MAPNQCAKTRRCQKTNLFLIYRQCLKYACTNYSHLIDCLDSLGAEIQMRRASPIYQLAKYHLSIGSRVYLKRERWEWLPLWIHPNTWSHLITKLSRGMAPLSNPKIWAGQKRPSSVKGGSPKIFLFFHKVPLDMIYGGEIVKRGRWALKKWNSGFGGMINYESALCCGEIMINDVRPEARMLDFNLKMR